MVRALVLGATGHIGAHIVRALLRDGHQVRAAYRSEAALPVLEGLPVERVRADAETLEGMGRALEGCAWVFHAAGYYPKGGARRSDAVAHGIAVTRRLLALFQEARIERLVFTSSAATIRRRPDRAATEDDLEPWPLRQWRPLYATVKIAMEHEVLRASTSGLPVVIVNPSVCVGEYDTNRLSGRLVLVFARRWMPVYLDGAFHAVYTGDVGLAHARAAERGRLGARYLLAGEAITVREFATHVAQAAGIPPPRWRVPHGVAMATAHVAFQAARCLRTEPWLSPQILDDLRTGRQLDDTRSRAELAVPHTPIAEAIRRAVAWFKRSW